MEDMGARAIKIGMLHSPDIVRTVADAIGRHGLQNVVFDPVMVATSGAVLIDNEAVDVLVRELFPCVAVITPNLDEAALLVGRPLTGPEDMALAAQNLIDKGAHAVLLKGGHLPGDTVIDLMMTKSGEKTWMQAPRIQSPNTHGTGCTLSSAIAAHLALGASLLEAVQLARSFVRDALQAGAEVQTGHGSGPLNHGFAPVTMHLKSRL
jgi:hydroxymethylpyrimidine/phosphomethylpyrimidine kinase